MEQNSSPALSGLLDTAAAAKFLGLAQITLRQQRSQGPRDQRMAIVPFIKLGHAVRYSPEDLQAFVAAHRVTQSVETASPRLAV